MIVEGGVHTTSGPMGRPVMVLLAQRVRVVLAGSATTFAVVGTVKVAGGARQPIPSASFPLCPASCEAPIVLVWCVPYTVDSVVLESVSLV